MLCKEHRYEPLSKAIEHEYSAKHTQRVREHDRPTQLSSPLAAPMEPDAGDTLDVEETMLNASRSPLGSALYGDVEAEGFREVTPLSDIVPAYESNQLSSIYDVHTVHGPALPEDNPEQLYDNWGSEVAQVGEEENDRDDSDLSDDTDSESEDAVWDGYQRVIRPGEGTAQVFDEGGPSADNAKEDRCGNPSPDVTAAMFDDSRNLDRADSALAPDLAGDLSLGRMAEAEGE